MAIKTALLMNFIAPYRVPLFEALRDRIGALRIFISTRMEADRPWVPDWHDLDVVVQKTLTAPVRFRHPGGFVQQLYLHFPYDTLPQLWRYSPDVVISGEFGLRSLQAALYRQLRPKSRLIVWATLSEHTEKNWGRARLALRRFILHSADGVIVNGASGARYVSGIGFHGPIFTMNQPIDVSRLAALPLARPPEDAHRLIYCGRLIGQKGVVEFQSELAAWARRHPERDIDMLWVGDGELRAELEDNSVPANLRQRFIGYVTYDALPEVYRSCGTLVLPSFFDEWGLVVNEAMASGLPVLGSIYSQAVEEMVIDDKTGWQFDPLQPATIARALDRFFASSDEALATMRASARTRALAITPESAAEQMRKAILSLSGAAAVLDATSRYDAHP
ncbi:MAG TPA: glycosyltransferase family 4 protein [Patescibacteria group bacterium]|nr:glycosyltransferase family 4 protein [Patescibacteria group bacterium]